MTAIVLELLPYRAALLAGHDTQLDVLVRVIAPPAPASARSRLPLNLSLVVDRSGSMSGRPLAEAKRCVGMVIDRLLPTDRASLVIYDDTIDICVPSQLVTDREAFHRALRSVHSGGSTALHMGWAKGAEQVAMHLDRERALSRVILLSDGQANVGLRDPEPIAAQCAEMAAAGVTTSTYGLAENFNEELMFAMANSGRGNAYYGQTAEDLMDPFQQELDLIAALCARSLRLSVTAAEGVGVEIVNRYAAAPGGRTMLPDLAYAGEAWALVRLSLPKALQANTEGNIRVLTVTLGYQDLDGKTHDLPPVHLVLPVLPVGAFEAVASHPMVAMRAAELRAAGLQDDARQAARRGEWEEVDRIMAELRVEAAASPWLAASIDDLESYARSRHRERFSKEAFFKSKAYRSRLASDGEDDMTFALSVEAAKPSYLRRKPQIGKRLDASDDDK